VAKISMKQIIELKSKLLVKIELVLGCISLEGKPKRIPKYILNKFKEKVCLKEF
jgi:acyl-CoA thioesterase FadM